MLICGLKFTHDGAIALVKDNKLLFSIEVEKIENNPRFSKIIDTNLIVNILEDRGYNVSDVDKFIIDGFGDCAWDQNNKIRNNNEACNGLKFSSDGLNYKIKLAGYNEQKNNENILREKKYTGLMIANKEYNYSSFYHLAGHIMGAYTSSLFSKKEESSYVLVWDGGTYPRLYFFDAKRRKILNLGALFFLYGRIYYVFAHHFEQFKINPEILHDNLSVPGKVMAYIALGKNSEELFKIFSDIYINYFYLMGSTKFFSYESTKFFSHEFKKRIIKDSYKTEDVLCTFHNFIEQLLLKELKSKILKFNSNNRNLCFVGGSALNIKWNSAIRESGLFDKVYVPPFTNDSGSAIGMACCGMKSLYLDWSVFSGPNIIKNKPVPGWIKEKCPINCLAKILYKENEPVVILQGKSELGPRALGNRSIVAPAITHKMKDILNNIKRREGYRPISPICKEDRAKYIFDPGLKDPYMLFNHQVKKEWKNKIPAVIHLDGTARLQTVNKKENKNIYKLLDEYEKLSGIPVLCNTSANYLGKGFFPDIKSATKWGMVNYVWSDGYLYIKKDKVDIKNYLTI
ncbi:hypothetical protein A2331_04105 [Candidatus Falkowbacteria bacterium RIFOXYB2_FULL_34_18]|uniref:Carbamoyltransferase n=1 Tax=Candidatus Falkowbacteria bacterium RIFOXYD2_FULL_34_120 TaxID=1798007 RepID=A0A1F5TRX8_9BACT|nr:MAG: hypothetical protein A2331_04105 [Candidatus Falkowbacteria bacterium RIFOXYB2_FULL_34_18]OGF29724.1 MAG: hypothetical protein A2500_00420 [Candidatus Falkowbacteria bacterium RIFOXYC12_FULL_34_55]OGF37411.1 MAG: hypothetical protein A2466_00300 [Candidatus Falkowbacteria bacterium RIFOXYC2_FULL_34_220]OGF39136.1 MAG: hypothetical protein A2515_00255 [Candidatus Falkowbacteria bacterium RIFOXYD12_FULL_34_57]OGF41685.1 MAG: hypothetical protein A2531_05975 [Candidatus Falkowbacteria bact